MNEKLSVDESIIPFKGKSTLKQYNPKKPVRWGYKSFLLCDNHGLVYNIDFYTGAIQPVNDMPDIGASGNVVLNLASIIPPHKNFKLHFDNWFTSLKLEIALDKLGIQSIGTVRANRLPECPLKSEAELKKRGRGSYDTVLH